MLAQTIRHAAALALLLCSTGAAGHGFGQRYDLPVPLSFFLVSAGLVVLLSFTALAAFPRFAAGKHDYPRFDLRTTALGRMLSSSPVHWVLRSAGLFLYVLVIVAGLAGAQSALKNIAPVMVWVIAWVGLTYAAALLGNVWVLVNPMDTLFAGFEALYATARPGRRLSLGLRYPPQLGVWPAAALFLGFVWMELIWEGADSPARLARALLAYSFLTWLGMLLVGRTEWLRRGEVFSVVFAYLARFAPLEWRAAGARPEWDLRPYAVGLLARDPVHPSEIVLVTMMLAAVSFDGFLDTPAWATLVEYLGADGALARTLGLIAAMLLFTGVYVLTCLAIACLGAWPFTPSPGRAAGLFILTLLPITIAYHVAHYLSFFVMAGQYLVPLASDPLGRGWDLFGGARYFIRLAVIDARAVWYVSVTAIIVGHVAAIYLAHVIALREFPHPARALRSQYPMVALMVAYTMTSLWIIAQPIVTVGGR